MTEFWESSFQDKQEMWGMQPAASTLSALELFTKHSLKKILIPGFGYGRNARIFTEQGFDVTGIEISETAIDLAKKHFGNKIKVYHGSVNHMPFDKELYDGIFCYALLHLLNTHDRIKLIKDCYQQLRPGGYMVFITLSKTDNRYGQGKEISKDTFETKHGVNLFFYDSDSIKNDFGSYGLTTFEEVQEPPQKFWQIVCKKN